jgi:hypothetical protein
MTMKITLELSPNEAAALARLCDKFAHSDAKAFLYPHVPKEIRDGQAYDMVHATTAVFKALSDAGARGWPWIETGSAT